MESPFSGLVFKVQASMDLQFEVVSARLADEFSSPIKLDRLDYTLARRTDAEGARMLRGSVGIEVLTRRLDGEMLALFPHK